MNKFLDKLNKFRKACFFDVVTPISVAPTNYWIAGAIKNPGALRAKAQAAGAMTRRGTIQVAWLRRMATNPPDVTTGRQARLALQLRGFRKAAAARRAAQAAMNK